MGGRQMTSRLAYTPQDAARSLEPRPEPFGLAWIDPEDYHHYRDQYGQIGHHKPGQQCDCGPTKEKP